MRARLGQHFLRDESVIEQMLGILGQPSHDLIVEVGPGTGVLTKALLGGGHTVLAIEWDEVLLNGLANQFGQNDRLTLVQADIRHFNLIEKIEALGFASYRIVANLPYYLSSYLFRQIFSYHTLPHQVIVLIQKEVAERVSAPAGSSDRGVLSVLCQLYGTPRLALIVPPTAFTPPPKVDSAVLVIDEISTDHLDGVSQKELMRVVKAGFGEKRKTIENALAGGLQLSKESVRQWLRKADISPELRAQDLSISQWLNLYRLKGV